MSEPISFSILNYGCKVNTYDGGLLETRLKNKGHVISDHPQVFVINTCAVTAEATQEAVRRVRWLKKNQPRSLVVVTGCGAQVDTKVFSELKEVDLVVANSHKGKLEDIVKSFLEGQLNEKIHKDNIFRKLDLEEGGGLHSSHTRSFLKIQDGCNSFCTYCVIPFARGRSRSVPIENLVHRINELYAQNVFEVVLTGIHIGDYEDQGQGLEDLIEAILKNTVVPRIRLTSLEPKEISDRLIELFQDPRMCPHFHMSIQSANDGVLQRMKRKYTAQDVAEALNLIARRVPNAFVGMDVIVGFPGESEKDYLQTRQRLENWPWTKIHVFPYSERPGTRAINFSSQVLKSEIQRRAQDLRALSYERYACCALAQIGKVKKVLGLKNSKGHYFQGLSRDFWRAKILVNKEGLDKFILNKEIEVKIIGYDHSNYSQSEGFLLGEVNCSKKF